MIQHLSRYLKLFLLKLQLQKRENSPVLVPSSLDQLPAISSTHLKFSLTKDTTFSVVTTEISTITQGIFSNIYMPTISSKLPTKKNIKIYHKTNYTSKPTAQLRKGNDARVKILLGTRVDW